MVKSDLFYIADTWHRVLYSVSSVAAPIEAVPTYSYPPTFSVSVRLPKCDIRLGIFVLLINIYFSFIELDSLVIFTLSLLFWFIF